MRAFIGISLSFAAAASAHRGHTSPNACPSNSQSFSPASGVLVPVRTSSIPNGGTGAATTAAPTGVTEPGCYVINGQLYCPVSSWPQTSNATQKQSTGLSLYTVSKSVMPSSSVPHVSPIHSLTTQTSPRPLSTRSPSSISLSNTNTLPTIQSQSPFTTMSTVTLPVKPNPSSSRAQSLPPSQSTSMPTSSTLSSTQALPTATSNPIPCPNGNGTTYNDASGTPYVILCSTDSPSPLLSTTTALSIVDCISTCSQTNGCVAATYLNSTGICETKANSTTTLATVPSVGRTYAVLLRVVSPSILSPTTTTSSGSGLSSRVSTASSSTSLTSSALRPSSLTFTLQTATSLPTGSNATLVHPYGTFVTPSMSIPACSGAAFVTVTAS